ncbi:hypothetical protein THIOKS1760008 [Thiocapsa sp. KS1]|nr:hypothetical protein THIOKS1760008 [Thiocapsa sp. KS1]
MTPKSPVSRSISSPMRIASTSAIRICQWSFILRTDIDISEWLWGFPARVAARVMTGFRIGTGGLGDPFPPKVEPARRARGGFRTDAGTGESYAVRRAEARPSQHT